ncbi:TPA: hypothetical protein NJ263_003014 [Vibrio parahaemolyticus]|uniref:hypothetical protein n=1 Tax=Vibrio alginolyticus TaxID=663 RepID=UPI001BD579E2|nr:hypothetical protein [Vibrio alginolyticus]MBT0005607.1 hypothetical protein [Vibrio alginolyticus]HCG6789511.1 hypothetical protein [Vibrio parahaemolyticus]
MDKIHRERAKELGLPDYKGGEQKSYVKSVFLKGCGLNTYQARYIGIGNLHSVLSVLRHKDKMLITDTKERVIDPSTGNLTERPVINAWMTVEQRKDYFKRKKAQTYRRK